MKTLNKKITFPILCILALIIGLWGGVKWRDYKNTKSVVFRISTDKKMMDYDLQAAVNYLQYKLEKQGYTVLPWRYPGNFYHQTGDNAGINIFIRSNEFFYDTRMNSKAFNIYYLHRFLHIYAEEMQGYNYYLSSQKNLHKALPNYPNIGYFGVGAVPHKKLTPQYQYDVLYISETTNKNYLQYLKENYKYKYYSSLKFGNLTESERKDMLSQARIVIYDMDKSPLDDADYSSYAVYDIISYGRPLITNLSKSLYKTFGTNIYYYQNDENMIIQTTHALTEKDNIREAKAAKAREAVISDDISPLNLPL